MVDELRSVSRRSTLQAAACAAGAVILGAVTSPAQAAKMAKSAVAYQAKPKGDQNCAGCKLFESPNACKSVAGAISPQGWCNIWVKA